MAEDRQRSQVLLAAGVAAVVVACFVAWDHISTHRHKAAQPEYLAAKKALRAVRDSFDKLCDRAQALDDHLSKSTLSTEYVVVLVFMLFVRQWLVIASL